MRINWDTPVYELMHGGNIAYVDIDEGELVHFKYIKRKKLPNGKWRYYYNIGQDEKEAYDQAATAARKSAALVEAKRKPYETVKSKVESGEYFDKDNGSQSIIEPFEKQYKSARAQYRVNVKAARVTLKKYEATPLYKINKAKEKINKGFKTVSNWFKSHRIEFN